MKRSKVIMYEVMNRTQPSVVEFTMVEKKPGCLATIGKGIGGVAILSIFIAILCA